MSQFHDDEMPDIGDIYICDQCTFGFCQLPPGSNAMIPWHLVKDKNGVVVKCGNFVYHDKCLACTEGTCCNQAAQQAEKKRRGK